MREKRRRLCKANDWQQETIRERIDEDGYWRYSIQSSILFSTDNISSFVSSFWFRDKITIVLRYQLKARNIVIVGWFAIFFGRNNKIHIVVEWTTPVLWTVSGIYTSVSHFCNSYGNDLIMNRKNHLKLIQVALKKITNELKKKIANNAVRIKNDV